MKQQLQFFHIYYLFWLIILVGTNGLCQNFSQQERIGTKPPSEITFFEPASSQVSADTVIITHSLSQNIVNLNSVSCNNGSPNFYHYENSFYRAFNLATFGITDNFKVHRVEIGIQSANALSGTQPISIKLYISTSGVFPSGTLSNIGNKSVNVSNQTFSKISIPVSGTAPAGSELVVEVLAPDGRSAGNSFFLGSNPNGQTGSSYIRAPGCGTPNPVTTGSIGFPNSHFVLNVVGTVGDEPPALSEHINIHQTPEFKTGITNEGSLGMLNSWGGLPGWEWPIGVNQLFEASLMIAIAPNQVSDAARVINGGVQTGESDGDFQFLTNFDTIAYDANSMVLHTLFNDNLAHQPPLADDGPNRAINVKISQTSSSFSDAENSGYLIMKWTVTNKDDIDIENLLIGMFMDWDINNVNMNTGKVTIDTISMPEINQGNPFLAEFVYLWDTASQSPYFGVVPLSQSLFRASRIADNPAEIFSPGNGGFGDGLSETAKYEFMLNRRTNNPYGDAFDPNDKSLVVGLGGGTPGGLASPGFTLMPDDSVTVGIAIIGGNNLDDFFSNGIAAMKKWALLGNGLIPLDTTIVGIPDEPLSGVPNEFELFQNYPNPFNPITTIRYDLPKASKVVLKIYNILGQEVRTLVNSSQTTGEKSVIWDGRDAFGQEVSSGIYLYRLKAGYFIQSRKMLLMQ